MGPNGLSLRVLRKLADVPERPLSIIFERSWSLGKVLKNWRNTNVAPIFHRGQKDDPRMWVGW